MHCSLCGQSLQPEHAWKGTTARFYCSEFCAESENVPPSRPNLQKAQIDQRYLDRLERLLPLRQQFVRRTMLKTHIHA